MMCADFRTGDGLKTMFEHLRTGDGPRTMCANLKTGDGPKTMFVHLRIGDGQITMYVASQDWRRPENNLLAPQEAMRPCISGTRDIGTFSSANFRVSATKFLQGQHQV